MWKRLFRRGEAPAAEVEVSRVRILFNHFRRIMDLNNATLQSMAAMERALGGEYIFDNAFLDASVRELSSQVHHTAYSLNALTGNRHVPLYDRFQDIRSTLETILSGGPGPRAERPVLALDDLGWDTEPLAGIEAVCQAELRRHSGLPVADGFVLTVTGTRIWRGQDPCQGACKGLDPEQLPKREQVRAAVAEQAERLAHGDPRPKPLTARLVAVVGQTVDAEEGQAILRRELPSATCAPDQLDQILDRLLKDPDQELEGLTLAVLVCPEFEALVRGQARTRAIDSGRLDALRITAHEPDDPEAEDRFLMRRAYPFEPLRSRISPRSTSERFADGKRAVSATQGGFLRGSALVDGAVLRGLAETAMSLERMLGLPARLEWHLDRDGICRVQRPRPLPQPRTDAGADAHDAAHVGPEPGVLDEVAKATVLCRGGSTVQAGVAAGRVVHVDDAPDAEHFPPGAIAVAKNASPRLTPVLHRAGALITEMGTPAGHLATVARELRLPAVFGMAEALDKLPDGTETTLDAAEAVAYQGVLDGLLRSGWGAELYPTDPEYRTLRRLLRFIRPLNLTDPEADNFNPAGCRTYHDIIHYCHEMAVDELANLQERRPGLGNLRTRRLETGMALPIRILDIGGGLAENAPPEPGFEHVRCRPLNAFLSGLRQPDAWDDSPADLRIRDVFASLPKTLGQLNAQPSALSENLAIAGSDYLNLSLRLGYHFSVVDAYLGQDAERSHVYFRFVGGLADAARRSRRVRLIRDVLEVLDFNTSLKDDLVVGNLKQVAPAVSWTALATLGALTAFVRQRDTAMRSDQDERALFDEFEQRFLNRPLTTPLTPPLGTDTSE